MAWLEMTGIVVREVNIEFEYRWRAMAMTLSSGWRWQ